MVVVSADGAHSPHVCDFDGVAVPWRIELSVAATLLVVGIAGTVFAVHTPYVGTGLFAFVFALQPQLAYASGAFTIKDGADTLTVPLSAANTEPVLRAEKLSMTIGEVLITFDEKGLGIRYGNKGGFTTLPYVPRNPALFDETEAARVAALIASGERRAQVSAVSGFEVVEDKIYMLLRWDDKSGSPWLEVLTRIDTSSDAPKVELLGRFGGFSFASGPVSDELHSQATRLFTPLRAALGLGIGSYDVASGETKFANLGPMVDSVSRIGSRYFTVRKTTYGLSSVGVIDPIAGKHTAVLETRGEVVPSSLTSALVVKENGTSSLFALGSGARFVLPSDFGCAQTPYGVLVWTPKGKPTEAILRETDGFTSVAAWKAKR